MAQELALLCALDDIKAAIAGALRDVVAEVTRAASSAAVTAALNCTSSTVVVADLVISSPNMTFASMAGEAILAISDDSSTFLSLLNAHETVSGLNIDFTAASVVEACEAAVESHYVGVRSSDVPIIQGSSSDDDGDDDGDGNGDGNGGTAVTDIVLASFGGLVVGAAVALVSVRVGAAASLTRGRHSNWAHKRQPSDDNDASHTGIVMSQVERHNPMTMRQGDQNVVKQHRGSML